MNKEDFLDPFGNSNNDDKKIDKNQNKPSEKPQVYSHSKLSTFEQCKLKYKYRYIDKIKPEIEGSIEAHLGSSVHSTLEWIYKTIKNSGGKKIPSIDETIQFYIQIWEANYSEKLVIVRDLSPKDYFNKGLKFLLDYYSSHYPFNDNTLDLEKQIIIDLDESGKYKIRGFIDRLVHNLKTGEYEIHDYKTSNTLPGKEKFETDRQLALYSIGIKETYGKDKEVRLVWHYLAFNKKIESKRTDYQLELLKKETIELIKEIESTLEFPPTKSPLCDWCEYKSICPAWNTSEEVKFERELIDGGENLKNSQLNFNDDYPKKESNKSLDIF